MDMTRARCSLMNASINPATAAVSDEYEGKTKYFRSHACHEQFKAEPERYAT